jgi:26S proteasome regulatory subunit T2
MGNLPPGAMGGSDPSSNNNNNPNDKPSEKEKPKKRFEPRPARKSRRLRRKGLSGIHKTPTIAPSSKCKLRMLKLDRVKDYLLLEQEFIRNFEGT